MASPERLVEPPGGDGVWLARVHIRAQLHGEGAGLFVAQGAPKAMGGGSTHQQAQRCQQKVHFPAPILAPCLYCCTDQDPIVETKGAALMSAWSY